MSEDSRFMVLVIDGDTVDLLNPGTESLKYCDLSWSEAVELARLSFTQGFEIVIWMMDGEGKR